MAELLFELVDSRKAVASLLLAYEFSENREKTRAYFEGKSVASDRNAELYRLALKRVENSSRIVAELSYGRY
jgi:hypothetical protein